MLINRYFSLINFIIISERYSTVAFNMHPQSHNASNRQLLFRFLPKLNNRVMRSIHNFIRKSSKLPQIKQPSKFKLLHDLNIISAYKKYQREFLNTEQMDSIYQEIEARACSEVEAAVGIVPEFVKERLYHKLCHLSGEDIWPHVAYAVDLNFCGQDLISALFKTPKKENTQNTQSKVIEIDSSEEEQNESKPEPSRANKQAPVNPQSPAIKEPPAINEPTTNQFLALRIDQSNSVMNPNNQAPQNEPSPEQPDPHCSQMEPQESNGQEGQVQSGNNDFDCLSQSEQSDVFVTFNQQAGTIQPYLLGVTSNMDKLHDNLRSIYREVAKEIESERLHGLKTVQPQHCPLAPDSSDHSLSQNGNNQTVLSLQSSSPQQQNDQQGHNSVLPDLTSPKQPQQVANSNSDQWFQEQDSFLRESVQNGDYEQLKMLLKYHSCVGVYQRIKKLRIKVSEQYLEMLGQLSEQ